MKTSRIKILWATTLLLYIITALPIHLSAMTLIHSPKAVMHSGLRFLISLQVEDPKTIDVVRIYFKAKDSPFYSFIKMRNDVRSKFIGYLPAARQDCERFEYLFLVHTTENKIYRSQTFNTMVTDNNIPPSRSNQRINIYTELIEMVQKIPGFSDNIKIDSIDPSLKFGTIAGLYSHDRTDSTSSGIFAGNVLSSAPREGVSRSSMLVGGATVVTLAVGGVALSVGSSDGGDISFPDSTDCPYTGNWAGSWRETICQDREQAGYWDGSVDDNCNFSLSKANSSGPIDPNSGEASFLGGSHRISCDSFEYETVNTLSRATFRGGNVDGSYRAENVIGTFTGTRQ